MLQDPFERRFSYLRLSLTESCNFRCNYCLPNGSACDNKAAELTLAEIKHLVHGFAYAGTTKVRLTGGEPTLRRDLCDIIHTVRQTAGIREVALTTNGYRLNKDIHHWLDAGLTALNVSIDSLDADTFHLVTGQDRLADILAGIDRALTLGLRKVKINTVLLRQYNGQSLSTFLDFVRDKPISLRFIELMQTGDNGSFFKAQHLSGSSIIQQLTAAGWQLIPRQANAGPALEYTHPGYLGSIGLIMPYSAHFCDDCNRLRVSSTGQLFLCLFAEQHQNLRHLLSEDNPAALMAFLQAQLRYKPFSHQLANAKTGQTRQLAMIGG
ncbi:GTP 3',8-cyclase MoaA [Rheinheimera texasensis]|uniref:GTP 3',8-cyclase MoaA n=1 Tax=Rheinheimera texasensis TaxID=306205 RepID=UPI0032B26D89